MLKNTEFYVPAMDDLLKRCRKWVLFGFITIYSDEKVMSRDWIY